MKRILITGAAGFIGFHLASALQRQGNFCIGLDHFNSYYDVKLKLDREKILKLLGIEIIHADILDKEKIDQILKNEKITHVIHLAAQAGVRHSLTHPDDYVSSNLSGFVSILENLRKHPEIKLIYASSSSIYGANRKNPFSVSDLTDHPTNLYGASKKANELIAHSYHHLFGISAVGLRYFTVYGPWGRPDMAYYLFSKKILDDQPIQIFNHGKMKRDFTYIDDIVKGTIAALDLEPGYRIFNLGNNKPIELIYFIELLEKALGKKAKKEFLPMQPGEVIATFADIDESKRFLNYEPKVLIEEGIELFAKWFKQYHVLQEQSELHPV